MLMVRCRLQLWRQCRKFSVPAWRGASPTSHAPSGPVGTKEVRIFRSRCDWPALAANTWRQCLLGSLVGVGGAAAAASAVPSMPLAAAVACAGALPPLVALWMVPRQMRDAAAGFVEEVLVLVPWPNKPGVQEEEQARSAAGPPEGPACSVSDESVRASSELLAAFHGIDVLLRSPFLVRHLRLEEAQQAKPLLRRSGFVSDSRPSFRHLCSLPSSEGGQSRVGRRGPLHINPTEGLSTDSALLAALLRSEKVLASEHMESRKEEADGDAQLQWRLPESLDELTEGFPESPPRRMERLGRRCLALGGAGALCGVLFHQEPVSSLILSICAEAETDPGAIAWDPLWTLSRLSHFAPLLQKAGPPEWHRPELCEGEDTSEAQFVFLHRVCCEMMLYRDALMNFILASGAAAFVFDAAVLVKASTLSGCELCLEAAICPKGLWGTAPADGPTSLRTGSRLPVAAILGLRRVCVLRATLDAPWSPHAGAIYGLRDCADLGGCLEVGRDRVGMDLGFIKEVPSAAACRLQCHETQDEGRRDKSSFLKRFSGFCYGQECKAFSYFPDGYLGDASAGCVLPAAVFTWWKTRCLLKMHKTKPASGEQWLQMGNVASGQRGCKPARPWRRWSISHQSVDDLLAVDGDYRRERCSRGQPWRLELDAEYIVTRVMLWTGQLQTLPFREPLVYEVGEEEVWCGSADENLGGNAMAVHCAQDTSRSPASAVIIRSIAGPALEFALCEVEVQVAPVPCDLLLDKGWTIHGRVVLIFPPGEAGRAKLEDAGEACERAGGSLVPSMLTFPGFAFMFWPDSSCACSACWLWKPLTLQQHRRRVLLLWIAACWCLLGRGGVFLPPPSLGPSSAESSNALRAAAPLGVLSVALAPAAAHAAEVVEATIDPSDAIVQAFALTFVSEIGDKTFFIAAILAAGSSAAEGLSQKVLTFIGAISALAVMTVIAVSIGQVFHAVPDAAGGLPLDDYASILAILDRNLFGYFGVKLLLDASTMADDGSILAEEKEEAEEAVNSSLPEWVTKLSIPALVVQAFILVFAAEVGDRSFISAAALSAQGGPEGAAAVFVGAIAAHAIATLLAVALGDLISTYVSESWLMSQAVTFNVLLAAPSVYKQPERLDARPTCRAQEKTLTYIGGGLFLFFAATSTANVAATLSLQASFAPHPRTMASAREDKAKMASTALRKLMTLSKSGSTKSSTDATGSREQASLALRELCRGLVPKSGEQDINEMDAKFQALLEKILAQRGELVPAPAATSAPVAPLSAEGPEELAAKLGPEPVEEKKPEPLRRRLVLTEEGGMLASVRVKVLEASKALRAKDNMVTQLTQKLKQCRKEVWDLQCEANAADLRVARILQQNSAKLPENYRREFEELKEKEEELADVLAVARAEAQRWASVAKRQDAMLQQEGCFCGPPDLLHSAADEID
eukprot:s2467_g10.t1